MGSLAAAAESKRRNSPSVSLYQPAEEKEDERSAARSRPLTVPESVEMPLLWMMNYCSVKAYRRELIIRAFWRAWRVSPHLTLFSSFITPFFMQQDVARNWMPLSQRPHAILPFQKFTIFCRHWWRIAYYLHFMRAFVFNLIPDSFLTREYTLGKCNLWRTTNK